LKNWGIITKYVKNSSVKQQNNEPTLVVSKEADN